MRDGLAKLTVTGKEQTSMTTYISCADTAKLVRARLAETFPKSEYRGVKFSVTSRNFTSIRIEWVNGPTSKAVEAAVAEYVGADFDGMTDLQTPRTATGANGERVHYGSNFISCYRTVSLAFAQKVVDAYCTAFSGMPRPELAVSGGDAYIPWHADTSPEDDMNRQHIIDIWRGLDSRIWEAGFIVSIERGRLEAVAKGQS